MEGSADIGGAFIELILIQLTTGSGDIVDPR